MVKVPISYITLLNSALPGTDSKISLKYRSKSNLVGMLARADNVVIESSLGDVHTELIVHHHDIDWIVW